MRASSNRLSLVGAHANVYVEWDQNILHNTKKDKGSVTYALSGTSSSFQLLASAASGSFNLSALFDHLSSSKYPQGSTINFGWAHDGATVFAMSGTLSNLSCPTPVTDWMHSNLDTLGSRTLQNLCIPGSHDCGMSKIDGHTGFSGNPDVVLTQTDDIAGQLAFGARYFDIRPVIASGAYKTGHYSKLDVIGWQGANGQSFSSIVQEINAFTSQNKELIVLNLSHDLDTDAADRNYSAFTQEQYNGMLAELAGLNNLFIAPNPTQVDLTTLTLNQFIGNGAAAVIVIVQPNNGSVTLGDYAQRGFYTYSQFNAYNSYSDTNDLGKMTSDQLSKLRSVRTNPNAQLFLLSWTLTQSAKDIILGTSIKDLANEAYPSIFEQLPAACSAQTYPNILYIDNWVNANVTALALAINSIVSLP